MNPTVSVIVPFYNEVDNVRPLWEGVTKTLEGLASYECIFVDDGSSDGTAEALNRLAAEDARVRPIRFLHNAGQSAALIAGMRAARGDFILTLDGDLQNDPVDFPRILELLKEYDCVYGVRVNRRDTWVRKLSSRIANRVRNAILHDGIQDSGCGTKGFRRCCIEHFVAFNGAHRFFAVMVRNARFTITECPVKHHPRQFGESKYGIHNRLWRGLYDLFGVAWLRRRYVIYEIADDAPKPTSTDSEGDGAATTEDLSSPGKG